MENYDINPFTGRLDKIGLDVRTRDMYPALPPEAVREFENEANWYGLSNSYAGDLNGSTSDQNSFGETYSADWDFSPGQRFGTEDFTYEFIPGLGLRRSRNGGCFKNAFLELNNPKVNYAGKSHVVKLPEDPMVTVFYVLQTLPMVPGNIPPGEIIVELPAALNKNYPKTLKVVKDALGVPIIVRPKGVDSFNGDFREVRLGLRDCINLSSLDAFWFLK